MLQKQDWWEVISNYNISIFPLQFILLGLGIATFLAFVLSPRRLWAIALKGYLIVTNLWTAFIFFLWPGRGFSSPLGEAQGGLFIVISLLLIYDLIANRTELDFPREGFKRILALITLVAIFLYPLWGFLAGQEATRFIYPGTFPCPNTALALFLVITARSRKNPLLYFLLLLWAVPFPPLVQIPKYGVYEDGIMLVLGLVMLFLLTNQYLGRGLRRNENREKPASVSVALIALGVLKGYVNKPIFLLMKSLFAMPGFIGKYRSEYPPEFLKTCGLVTILYSNLKKHMEKEKAFEIIRAFMITAGMAVQQSNFRNVEETRCFSNLIKNQQRTHREGPTRFNKMEIIEESDNRYEFRVSKCMFFDFFKQAGVKELTSLMCSIDNGIFNTYLPEEVLFHRNGIGNRIADGCESCSFVVENKREDLKIEIGY